MGLRHALTTSCDDESAYFCIRVVDQTRGCPVRRGPRAGARPPAARHQSPLAPEMLIAPYVHGIDELAYAQFGADYDRGCDWFFAGGGAYSQPRAVQTLSPASASPSPSWTRR
jgi:hypothetical protein